MEDLLDLPGFAEKSATNLVEAIQARKTVDLARFLHGLGIPEVGASVARDLAAHFRSFEAIRTATREELEGVEGIGPKMSEAITEFLQEPRNSAAIDQILAREMELKAPERTRVSDALQGARFVFTGGLSRMTRGQAKKLVESAGAKVVGSVSGSTTHVVVGEDPGSKYDKAVELGIQTLDEEAFIALLKAAGVSVEEA